MPLPENIERLVAESERHHALVEASERNVARAEDDYERLKDILGRQMSDETVHRYRNSGAVVSLLTGPDEDGLTPVIQGGELVDFTEAMFRIHGVPKDRAQSMSEIVGTHLIDVREGQKTTLFAPGVNRAWPKEDRIQVVEKRVGMEGLAYVLGGHFPSATALIQIDSDASIGVGGYPSSFVRNDGGYWCIDRVGDLSVGVDFGDRNAIVDSPDDLTKYGQGKTPNLIVGHEAVEAAISLYGGKVKSLISSKALKNLIHATHGEELEHLTLSAQNANVYLDDLSDAVEELLRVEQGHSRIPTHLYGGIVDLANVLANVSAINPDNESVAEIISSIAYRALSHIPDYNFTNKQEVNRSFVDAVNATITQLAVNPELRGDNDSIKNSLGSPEFVERIAISAMDLALGYAHQRYSTSEKVRVNVGSRLEPKRDKILRKARTDAIRASQSPST